MRRARAYSSSCSQVILVCLYPFRCNSLFCSQKWQKKSLKTNIFRVQGHLRSSMLTFLRSSLLVLVMISSMSVHICNYFHARQEQRINNHFLEGYPSLIPTCATVLERRGFRIKLLKFIFHAENFVRKLFWSVSSHFGAVHF